MRILQKKFKVAGLQLFWARPRDNEKTNIPYDTCTSVSTWHVYNDLSKHYNEKTMNTVEYMSHRKN